MGVWCIVGEFSIDIHSSGSHQLLTFTQIAQGLILFFNCHMPVFFHYNNVMLTLYLLYLLSPLCFQSVHHFVLFN